MKKDSQTLERFIELRAQGRSYQTIAEDLGVSKQSLINWSKDLEVRVQIENFREIELETLREKYRLTKKANLELFGERLEALRGAFKTRDLAEISTEKLLDLLLKHEGRLQGEAGDGVVLAETKEGDIFEDLISPKKIVTWRG